MGANALNNLIDAHKQEILVIKTFVDINIMETYKFMWVTVYATTHLLS